MLAERITWERCPRCGDAAAVGWVGKRPIELDCTTGCPVPQDRVGDLLEVAARRRLYASIT